jgi:hypothetical protein
MTKSCDLYREAAEAARAALTEATGGAGVPRPADPGSVRPDGSPLTALTKAFGRFRGPNK